MTSPFESLLNGENSNLVIFENEHFLAAVENAPLVLGHMIVLPKKQTDFIFDLSDDDLSQMMIFAKPVAQALKLTVPCKKIGMAAIGLVARHAHLHLVPINSADDLNFTREKLSPSRDELLAIAEKIKRHLRK